MNKIICDCGCEINKNYLYSHKKTKKHIDLIGKTIIIKDDIYEYKEYEHGGDYWDNLNGVNFDDY